MASNTADAENQQRSDQSDEDQSVTISKAGKSQFEKLSEFYRGLAVRLEVFDPLDRKFKCADDDDSCDEDDNQAITCKDLNLKIKKMKGLRGEDLNMPLTHSKYLQLQDMFSKAHKDILKLAEE